MLILSVFLLFYVNFIDILLYFGDGNIDIFK